MAIGNNRRVTIRLTHSELTFRQKLLRSEYHFIVEEERHARQAFGRKLSDITLPGSSDGASTCSSHSSRFRFSKSSRSRPIAS